MKRTALYILVSLSFSLLSQAERREEGDTVDTTIYDIVFGNSSDTDTFFWEGRIDTSGLVDVLNITNWNAGTEWNGGVFGNDPGQVSDIITMTAMTGSDPDNLTPFDIPDSWDGTFNNWGFIADLANSEINWLQGAVPAGQADAKISWHMRSQGDSVFYEASSSVHTRNIPMFNDSKTGSHNALPTTITPVAAESVPEPSSTLLIGLSALGFTLRRQRKQK